jgi:hypothetical protein
LVQDINLNIEFVKFLSRFLSLAGSDVEPLKGFTLPTGVHTLVLAGDLGERQAE